MMPMGGNTVRGIDVLRHQRDLLGEVASPATLSRALGAVDDHAPQRIDAARAGVRARVWDLIVARHGRIRDGSHVESRSASWARRPAWVRLV